MMYSFPQPLLFKTVIGFEDKESKKFFLEVLSEIYHFDFDDEQLDKGCEILKMV